MLKKATKREMWLSLWNLTKPNNVRTIQKGLGTPFDGSFPALLMPLDMAFL